VKELNKNEPPLYLLLIKIELQEMSSSLGRSSSTSAISSAIGDKKALMPDLDRPQYNSSLKLIKKFDEINIGNNSNNNGTNKMLLANNQLEKINEKVFYFGHIFLGILLDYF
jgi:hypothetical protein